MSVTSPVHHVEMWPYIVVAVAAFENQAVTAVRMLLSPLSVMTRPLHDTAPKKPPNDASMTMGVAVGAYVSVVGAYDGASVMRVGAYVSVRVGAADAVGVRVSDVGASVGRAA